MRPSRGAPTIARTTAHSAQAVPRPSPLLRWARAPGSQDAQTPLYIFPEPPDAQFFAHAASPRLDLALRLASTAEVSPPPSSLPHSSPLDVVLARHGRSSAELARPPSPLLLCPQARPAASAPSAAAAAPPSLASLAPCAPRPSRHALGTPSPVLMPLDTGALLAWPNRAQASERPRAQHPMPDRPWLAKVAEPPSPTPLTSLQPAPTVRLPSPCLGLAVSRVVHVKSRVRSASPCSRSRRRATSARTRVRLCAVRRRDSVHARLPLVYPPPPPVCIRVARLAIACASRIKSSHAVRARCACRSHALSCASSHVNNPTHLE
jgi:hypothetical protein